VQTIGNIVYLGLSLISAGVFLFGLRRKISFNRVSTYPIPPANLPSKTLSIALKRTIKPFPRIHTSGLLDGKGQIDSTRYRSFIGLQMTSRESRA
jgi:hypothetical protein